MGQQLTGLKDWTDVCQDETRVYCDCVGRWTGNEEVEGTLRIMSDFIMVYGQYLPIV